MNQTGGWESISEQQWHDFAGLFAHFAVNVDDIGDRSRRRSARLCSSARSTVPAISAKPMRRPRKAATATSLAALRTIGAAPPASSASRASRKAGKRPTSGFSKSSRRDLGQVEALGRRRHPLAARPGHKRSGCACRASRAGRSPSRRHIRPANGSPTAGGRGCRSARPATRTDDGPRSAPAPCSSSSPNRPRSSRPSTNWDGRRPARASLGAMSSADVSAERAAAGGQDQSCDILRAIAGKALENSIMLAVHRQDRGPVPWPPRRSSASPAVTSASLLASATVRPASTAAITGSSPAQPTIAAMTQSASPAAASSSASRPAAARQPLPASACSSSRQLRFVGDDRQPGAWSDARLGQRRRHCSPPSVRRPRTARASARRGRGSTCRPSRSRRGWRACASPQPPADLDQSGQRRHHDQPVEPVEHAAVARAARCRCP